MPIMKTSRLAWLLGHLFLGARAGCLAAADADGDGGVALNDALYLLVYLFQGGPPPPAPFPDCGAGAGELGCSTPSGCEG